MMPCIPYLSYLSYIPHIPYICNIIATPNIHTIANIHAIHTIHTKHTILSKHAIPDRPYTPYIPNIPYHTPTTPQGGRGTVPHPHHTTGGGGGRSQYWTHPMQGGGVGVAGPGAYIDYQWSILGSGHPRCRKCLVLYNPIFLLAKTASYACRGHAFYN